MKLSYLILLVVMNVFWAASISIYKNLAVHLSTGSIVTLRFGLAAVVLLPFWKKMSGKSPRGIELVKTMLMGVIVFCIGHRLQVYGDKLGGAGNSSVLMGTEPILTSLAAAFFLREKIALKSWMGFVLGLLGIAMLNGLFGDGFQIAGLSASLIFMSSFLCEAVYSILGKKLIENGGMLKILTLALLSGTTANLMLNGFTIAAEIHKMALNEWLQVVYLATICTSVGYAVWFLVIKETDVNLTAMTIFVQPVAGVVIANAWLGEKLHLGQLWGCLAILAGLIVALSGHRKDASVQNT
jgi:drug/metabolite transporter (DMT)-like permease